MPAGKDVRPQKWSEVKNIFDNGWYSAIWGIYLDDDGKSQKAVGVRWNGEKDDDKGFPKLFNKPIWHVEPSFLSKMLLLGFLVQSIKDNTLENIQNILTALSECE